MTNVLHLIDTTGPAGAETVLLNIVKRLDKNRYRSCIALPDKGWLYKELKGLKNVSLEIIKASGSFNTRLISILLKLVKNKNIDIIHSHLFGTALYGSILGMLSNLPVVCTLHGSLDLPANRRLMGLKRLIINVGSSRIVFVSDHLRRFFINTVGLNEKKCQVIYNGIDFQDDENTYNIDDKTTCDFEKKKYNYWQCWEYKTCQRL